MEAFVVACILAYHTSGMGTANVVMGLDHPVDKLVLIDMNMRSRVKHRKQTCRKPVYTCVNGLVIYCLFFFLWSTEQM